MTEQEYIDVSDLTRIRTILETLHHIIPANSEVIKQEEFEQVYLNLTAWRDRLEHKLDPYYNEDEED